MSALAHPLWLAATIDQVGTALGITGANIDSEKAFVLATASFLIPALDIALRARRPRAVETVAATVAPEQGRNHRRQYDEAA